MCPFIETIRIEDGVACNLAYHNQRMNQTRADHFVQSTPLDVRDYITLPQHKNQDRIKCRVVYSNSIEEVTYIPYTLRHVNTLQIVYSDTIDYHYKSTDREALNQLFTQKKSQDEILIVKNGLLTDTSIANIALFDGYKWYTPSTPLLKGTQRAFLLDKAMMHEEEIDIEQLFSYKQIALFNAMIPFGEIIIQIDKEHMHF
ncbi:aminotransferase class IV family protein [uncultured Bacteroides sp.]|uniref:aminotransferase class IV family protein n=1 Tax=uncultured Bacteroides sp. TaxID=162156 RepID=UPI002AA82572|nr:aminotransferase class IV family protein [uncultured Bacteroides sp.]